nr:MAG TPA_asm: bromodomain protein [Caudoviricetes sp.]
MRKNEKDLYERRSVDLARQCKNFQLDIENREYLIKEQYQRIDRKQASFLKILDECKDNSYKSLHEFREKIKELAETGIKY